MAHLCRCIHTQEIFSCWLENTTKESRYICPCFDLKSQCATREGGLEGAFSLTRVISCSEIATHRTFEKLEEEYICMSFGNVNISRHNPLVSIFNNLDFIVFKFSRRGCIIRKYPLLLFLNDYLPITLQSRVIGINV